MSTLTTNRMSVAEFAEWVKRPENAGTSWELEEGKPINLSQPISIHGIICLIVGQILLKYLFDRGDGDVIGSDAGLVLSEDPPIVRGPDLMLYLESRDEDKVYQSWMKRPPQLVVEVFSPSDRMSRLPKRVAEYHKFGVPLVWVIFPEEETMHVYLPDEFPKLLEGDDELTGNGTLPGFSCPVSKLFQRPKKKA